MLQLFPAPRRQGHHRRVGGHLPGGKNRRRVKHQFLVHHLFQRGQIDLLRGIIAGKFFQLRCVIVNRLHRVLVRFEVFRAPRQKKAALIGFRIQKMILN